MKSYGARICKIEAFIKNLRNSINRISKALAKVHNCNLNKKHLQNNYVKRLLSIHKKQKRWAYKNFNGLKLSLKSVAEMAHMRKLFKALRHTKIVNVNQKGRYLFFLTYNELYKLRSFFNRDNRRQSSFKIKKGKHIPYLTNAEYIKFKLWLKKKHPSASRLRWKKGKHIPHLTDREYNKLRFLLKKEDI
jgi:hypothetical protein